MDSARHDIAFKLLTVDQVLVTKDHDSVHVPLGVHGSDPGASVEYQQGIYGQLFGQTCS